MNEIVNNFLLVGDKFIKKTALTTVENEIPDVNNLVKKHIMTLKLQKLKINLIIIIMINLLLLQNLII